MKFCPLGRVKSGSRRVKLMPAAAVGGSWAMRWAFIAQHMRAPRAIMQAAFSRAQYVNNLSVVYD